LPVVLEDLVGRPSVLSRFGIVNVLTVAQNLTFSAVEGPDEDDLVLASTAGGSGLSSRHRGGVGDPKLKDDLLFGKTKGPRGVFHAVIDLVGTENFRHIEF